MSGEIEKGKNLNSGEFFGEVSEKRKAASLTLSEVLHAEKKNIPAHSHDLASFTLLLNGSYSETYRGEDFSYQPMSVWWHPPNTFHKDEVGQNGGRFFIMEVETKILENLKNFANPPPMFFEQKTHLTNLAFRFYHEFKNWQACSEMMAASYMLEMLAYSIRRSEAVEKLPPGWLSRVTDKLNEEFTKNVKTEALAAEADVHPVHLAAVFRKFHNQTIGEYVRERRVGHAAKLLLNRDLPLSEIALISGFSDQSHFTRVFKRVTGVTPGAFRKNLV